MSNFQQNRGSASSLSGDAPQVSATMVSLAWLSAGAVIASVMVVLLHGGFGSGSKSIGK